MAIKSWCAVAGIGMLVCGVAGRSFAQQKPQGFKFNNLTVSPYVNLEYTYDSNVDTDWREYDDTVLTVNPGVDVTYTGNDWGLSGNAWYGYDKYWDYDELEEARWGERLKFYAESTKWRFIVGQAYTKTHTDDSIIDGGRGIWRDRTLLEVNGAASYQVSEKLGVTLTGLLSDLDYENDGNNYAPLYGWRKWTVGGEVAHKLTEKSNLVLSGSYQRYESKGAKTVKDDSTGYSLMGGFASRATEKITYRLLVGANWFDYADADMQTGFAYTADVNWLINNKWAASLYGSSYFQPSERDADQSMQVYTVSAGVTYRPMRRLTTRFDAAYRYEENEYSGAGVGDITESIWSTRLRVDYKLKQYVTIYGAVAYENQDSDYYSQDFDRFRATIGLNLRY